MEATKSISANDMGSQIQAPTTYDKKKVRGIANLQMKSFPKGNIVKQFRNTNVSILASTWSKLQKVKTSKTGT